MKNKNNDNRSKGWTYFIFDPDVPAVKIWKAKDVQRRLKTFLTANYNLQLLGVLPGYTQLEKKLHQRFKYAKIDREWFHPVPEILKLAREAKQIDFDGVNIGHYPPPQPGQYPPVQMPGRTALRNGKSEKEKAESKAKKEFDEQRKRINKVVDRLFWAFMLVCLLTFITRMNY